MIFLGTEGKWGLGRETWGSSVIKVALQVRYLCWGVRVSDLKKSGWLQPAVFWSLLAAG